MMKGIRVNKQASHLKVTLVRFYKPLQKRPTSLLSGKKTELIIRKMAQQEEVITSCAGISLCVDH